MLHWTVVLVAYLSAHASSDGVSPARPSGEGIEAATSIFLRTDNDTSRSQRQIQFKASYQELPQGIRDVLPEGYRFESQDSYSVGKESSTPPPSASLGTFPKGITYFPPQIRPEEIPTYLTQYSLFNRYDEWSGKIAPKSSTEESNLVPKDDAYSIVQPFVTNVKLNDIHFIFPTASEGETHRDSEQDNTVNDGANEDFRVNTSHGGHTEETLREMVGKQLSVEEVRLPVKLALPETPFLEVHQNPVYGKSLSETPGVNLLPQQKAASSEPRQDSFVKDTNDNPLHFRPPAVVSFEGQDAIPDPERGSQNSKPRKFTPQLVKIPRAKSLFRVRGGSKTSPKKGDVFSRYVQPYDETIPGQSSAAYHSFRKVNAVPQKIIRKVRLRKRPKLKHDRVSTGKSKSLDASVRESSLPLYDHRMSSKGTDGAAVKEHFYGTGGRRHSNSHDGQIPETPFQCGWQPHDGYFADPFTDCKVFHVCWNGRKSSFVCPDGTIFSQTYLVCVWRYTAKCI